MNQNLSDDQIKELDTLRDSLMGQGEEETSESESLTEEQTIHEGEEQIDEVEEESVEEAKADESESEVEEELSDEEKKLLSEKAQARFRKIVQENKRLKEEMQSKVQPETHQQVSDPVEIDYSKLDVFNKEEVTPADYLKHVVEAADQIVERKLSQNQRRALEEQAKKTIVEDIAWAKQTFPELNDETPDYDETLANKVSNWYSSIRKTDPTMRLKDFVGEFMGERKKGFAKGKKASIEKIAKDEANQAFVSTQTYKQSSPKLEDDIKNARSLDDLNSLRSRLIK
jgi:hypothetical protein